MDKFEHVCFSGFRRESVYIYIVVGVDDARLLRGVDAVCVRTVVQEPGKLPARYGAVHPPAAALDSPCTARALYTIVRAVCAYARVQPYTIAAIRDTRA